MAKYRKRFGVVSIATALVVFGGGSAFAYWTVNGFGSSTATVAKVKSLVIDPVDIRDMVIGQPASLKGEVKNPNNFDASLTGLRLTVTMTVDRDHSGCAANNFLLVPPRTEAELIKANGGATFEGGTITLIDTGVDQTACQGAKLTLDYLLK
jgi:hypothetical protein